MRRLSGVDANLLYMETPTAHMHTIKIAVLEPAPGRRFTLENTRRELSRRLPLLPPFCRRLVEVPFGLHHPLWLDVEPDIEHHLRWTTAPAPGGPRQLDEVIAEIASVPLDRSRPLWEVHMVDGLAGGHVAAVAKIHHAAADGVAVATLLANVMDVAPSAASTAGGPRPRTEPAPSASRLVRDALTEHGGQLRELPRLMRRTAVNLRAVARRRAELDPPPPMPIRDTPRALFNGALTARRAFARVSLPLDDVRTVRSVLGGTVNDIVLAVVAGSLRRYLLARDALPSRPLLAEVPAATDAPGQPRTSGNELSNIFTSLCTDIDDPVDRLHAIHRTAIGAKELHGLLGAEMYQEWSRYAPPRAFAGLVRLYSRLRLADRHRPPVNVIVSSVPGPRQPLSWPGGRLADLFSVGPLIEGAGLNVTAWSYVDRLNFGILSCPDRLADPHELAEGIEESLLELLAALPEEDARRA